MLYMYGYTRNYPYSKENILLYMNERYYGSLNAPSSPILFCPITAKSFNLNCYHRFIWIFTLHKNNFFFLFLLTYAHLSNYLTLDLLRLNQ